MRDLLICQLALLVPVQCHAVAHVQGAHIPCCHQRRGIRHIGHGQQCACARASFGRQCRILPHFHGPGAQRLEVRAKTAAGQVDRTDPAFGRQLPAQPLEGHGGVIGLADRGW